MATGLCYQPRQADADLAGTARRRPTGRSTACPHGMSILSRHAHRSPPAMPFHACPRASAAVPMSVDLAGQWTRDS
jgi:hypothetical protein